jgi:hypothetical protein
MVRTTGLALPHNRIILLEAAQVSAGPCEAGAKDGPVPVDREEPNRVLGMPRRGISACTTLLNSQSALCP